MLPPIHIIAVLYSANMLTCCVSHLRRTLGTCKASPVALLFKVLAAINASLRRFSVKLVAGFLLTFVLRSRIRCWCAFTARHMQQLFTSNGLPGCILSLCSLELCPQCMETPWVVLRSASAHTPVVHLNEVTATINSTFVCSYQTSRKYLLIAA